MKDGLDNPDNYLSKRQHQRQLRYVVKAAAAPFATCLFGTQAGHYGQGGGECRRRISQRLGPYRVEP